jgi:chemotaxis protein MotB
MPARLATLPGPDARARQLLAAAPAWPGPTTASPDFADPPPQGSDDEIWMVSYMDIMTLLLTFFVLLFVYARAVAPDVAAATDPHNDPPHVATPREPATAGRSADLALLELPTDLGAVVESPAPGFAIRIADGSVTNPTVTVLVEAEVVGSPSPEPRDTAEAVGYEHPATPAAAPDGPVRVPEPSGRAPAIVAVVPADSTAATPERPAPSALAAEPTPDAPPQTPSEPAAGPEEALLAAIRSSELGRRVEVSVRKDAVSLEISDEILFDRGSASITSPGEQLLAELASHLAQQGVRISVEGHTDDSPIRTARFASNWELSAARATNVTRSLIAHAVDPARVRAVGYADTRPRADNASEQGRARNRRVALVLHVPAAAESAW